MTPLLGRLLLLASWIAGLAASLKIHTLDLQLGHGICGPWGCGPPLEALIGYHGFWLLIALPIAFCVSWWAPRQVTRQVGWIVLGIGLASALCIVGWDVASYAWKVRSGEYLAQRGLFTLVTTIDVPMLQAVVAGSWMVFVLGKPLMIESAGESDAKEPSF